MTFRSKAQLLYAANQDEGIRREFAFYLIEQTDLDVDQCRDRFELEYPNDLDVFEQCVDEALG